MLLMESISAETDGDALATHLKELSDATANITKKRAIWAVLARFDEDTVCLSVKCGLVAFMLFPPRSRNWL
jgi:hypothetical protein